MSHIHSGLGDPRMPARFWAKVTVSDDGCWLWQGFLSHDGYGRFAMKAVDRGQGAHRIVYTMLVGPIPEGLQIDHLCFVRNCVNPEHLEPVTNLENSRRRDARLDLTHCVNGHERTDANTYIVPATGARQCRECLKTRSREYQRRRRQVVDREVRNAYMRERYRARTDEQRQQRNEKQRQYRTQRKQAS